jgi:uncharacterized protein
MNKRMDITSLIVLLLVGLLAGMLSSMVGIGGGIVIVPALVLFLALDQKTAQGTSLALLMLPLGILGVMVYHKAGNVRWSYALIMAATFIIGSYFGAKIVNQLNALMVKRIFAVFMIVIAVKYLFFDKPKPQKTDQTGKTEQIK